MERRRFGNAVLEVDKPDGLRLKEDWTSGAGDRNLVALVRGNRTRSSIHHRAAACDKGGTASGFTLWGWSPVAELGLSFSLGLFSGLARIMPLFTLVPEVASTKDVMETDFAPVRGHRRGCVGGVCISTGTPIGALAALESITHARRLFATW